jgi:two-component system LytT family sensor kinase
LQQHTACRWLTFYFTGTDKQARWQLLGTHEVIFQAGRVLSGWINRKVPKKQHWKIGILAGMACETLTMILVVVWAPTIALGLDIVSKIGVPMILGSVCVGFIVLLVQSVEGEKEASAARQAKLALDIANKTLPLFRDINACFTKLII